MKRLYQIKINMRISLIIKTLLLLVLFSTDTFSQGTSPTTQGREFWLSFAGRDMDVSGIHNHSSFQIRIVASKATNVTFSFTENSSYNKTIPVAEGHVYTYTFTPEEMRLIYCGASGEAGMGKVTNKTMYITSTEAISVYAINLRLATTDATNVLPVNAYGIDYFILSYRSMASSSLSDCFYVIASESNTEIRVDGAFAANLNRGEVFRVHSAIRDDLTGGRITSSKPVAVFSANQNVDVPQGVGSADCLLEQMVPVSSWGTTYFVPVTYSVNASQTRDKDRIRIVASQNGTTITQTGGTVIARPWNEISTNRVSTLSSPLNAGQFVEVEINIADRGCYIRADKPVAVASYLMGTNNFPFSTQADNHGDPSFAWVPPVEQMVTTAAIAPFFAAGSSVLMDNKHYALIVTPYATKSNTRMAVGGGAYQALSGGTWTDNISAGYSFYSYNFPANDSTSTYYFENPAGFTILGYGLGRAESYYYLAAAASRQLSAAFYVNNVHYQDLDGEAICNNALTFRAEINFAMQTASGRLRWYVNGVEQTSARDQLQWTTSTLPVGTHTVRMVARNPDGETVEAQSVITVTNGAGGTISSDQSIAHGATPNPLTSITPATGGGTITYQWQSSTSGTLWFNISGATNGLSYAPGPLTATTHYRRMSVSDCGTTYSNTVIITVSASASVITAADRTICSGSAASLTASASSVTSPVFRWYSAATGGTLLRTGATYNPSPTTTTTYYVSVSGTSMSESARKAVTVTVADAMMSGTIGSDQSIASGTTPAPLTSISPASGGTGTITYRWQSSTNGTSWTNITGTAGANVGYSPGALTQTTYYRRTATNTCGTVETTSVLITVAASASIITAANREICSGEVAGLSATASSVTGPTFRWYNAATGGSLLHTGATYNVSPTSTTIYYVSVSGTSQAESARRAVTVTVMPTATPDMIRITQ